MAQSKGTWSKTGKTNFKKKQGFNWKKYAPFVAVIALVGGFFVWKSFAATKLYPYQYSVYQCSGFDGKKINPDDKCVADSAEAMTFRYYKGVLGKEPDSKGYAYWTQKFAGDRVQPTDVGTSFIAGSKTASAKTNQAFVEGIYQGTLGRKADTAGLKYWKEQLDSKKWSRGKVIAHFASQDSSKAANKATFANYLSKAAPVKIVETARKTRDERLWNATVNANEAQKLYDAMKGYTNTAKSALSSAKSSAGKSVPSTTDLKAIASNEKTVRDLATTTNSPRGKLADYLVQNKNWYERAKAVADYSPDLSADGIKKQYDRATVYSKSASNLNADLTGIISQISSQYKIAAGKYEASQAPVATNIVSKPDNTSGNVAVPKDIAGDLDKVNAYMTAVCASRTGTKPYGVPHGTAYRNITFRYAGKGTVCSVDKLGSYVSGAVFCDSGYAPVSLTSPEKGCEKYKVISQTCGSNQVLRGSTCVNKYADAKKHGCQYNYSSVTAAHGNRHKYTCKNTHAPFNTQVPPADTRFQCYDSANYKRAVTGNYAYCVRK